MDGLRIVVWCPEYNAGGGARLIGSLVPALARQAGVARVQFALPDSAPFEPPPGASPGRLEITRVAVPSWGSPDRRVLGIPGTGRIRREALRGRLQDALHRLAGEADLVYVPWPHRIPFLPAGRPVVCTFQDATLLEFPEILGGAATEAERASASAWLRGAARVVVSSRVMKATVARLFPGMSRTPVVIPHRALPLPGRASAETPPPVGPAAALGYVICPAALVPHKNQEALFVAWSRFGRRGEMGLVLCGAGTEQIRGDTGWPVSVHACRLAGLLARLDLRPGEAVHPLGYVSDAAVSGWIAGARAVVMPTLAEGGGSYPIEEALAAGVPVACSDIPVLREQFEGRSARVAWFDPLSPDSILRALENLFDDYETFRAAARQAAADPRPTWDGIAARYAELFRETLRSGMPPGFGPAVPAPDDLLVVPLGPEDETDLARFLTENDRPAITRQYHPFPLSAETARRIAREPRRDRYFGAIRDGRLVAFSMLRGWDEGFDIPSLGLLVDHRVMRRGIGRWLAVRTLMEARDAGARRVRLSLYASNVAALRLYAGLGFREVSRAPAQVGAEADEKIVMDRDLDHATEA